MYQATTELTQKIYRKTVSLLVISLSALGAPALQAQPGAVQDPNAQMNVVDTSDSDEDQRSAFATCYGCSLTCLTNGFKNGCFSLYDSSFQEINYDNMPRGRTYYFDAAVVSPADVSQCLCYEDNALVYGLEFPFDPLVINGNGSFSTGSCSCTTWSANGWEHFYLPTSAPVGPNKVGLVNAYIFFYQTFAHVFITYPGKNDLEPASFSLNKSSVQAGEGLKAFYEIRNYGELSASQVQAEVYVSSNSTVSQGDTLVASKTHSLPLKGGGLLKNSLGGLDFTIPSTMVAGKKYVKIYVTSNSTSQEYTTNNNWSEVFELDVTCAPQLDSFVNISVDSNNNGNVNQTVDGDDHIAEGALPGLLLPVNDNDSNGDGQLDHLDTFLDSDSDTRTVLVKLNPSIVNSSDTELKYGAVSLSVPGNNCRVFDQHGNYVLGAPAITEDGMFIGSAIDTYEIAAQSFNVNGNTLAYTIEAVRAGSCEIEASFSSTAESDLCSDKVKVSAFEVINILPNADDADIDEDTGFLELSADSPDFVYVTYVDFGPANSSIESVEIECVVAGGSATLSQNTIIASKIAGNTAPYGGTLVSASPISGQTLQLASQVQRVRYGNNWHSVVGPFKVSPTVITVSGEPAVVSTDVQAPIVMPAAEGHTESVTISAFDANGNLLPPHTGISVEVDGLSQVGSDSDEELVGSSAQLKINAGFASESAQALKIAVGAHEIPHVINSVDVDILLSGLGTVQAGADDYVQITATVTSAKPIPDGTPITWQTSLGSLEIPGVPRSGFVAEGAVVGGTSSVRVYTSAFDPVSGSLIAGADIAGTAHLTASVGFSRSDAQVVFTEPSSEGDIRLVVDRRTLAGDATQNGSYPVYQIGYTPNSELLIDIANHLGQADSTSGELTLPCPDCDLDGNGMIDLIDFVIQRNLPEQLLEPGQVIYADFYAETNATVFGVAHDQVRITVDDPAQLLEFEGIVPGEPFALDATGQKSFTIKSLGALAPDQLDQILITATRVYTVNGGRLVAGSSAGDQDEVALALAPVEEHGAVYSFFAGAIWGGGSGTSSTVGDAIAGFFLIGDIRDGLVETAKLWPGGEDPDGLTLSLAGLGIATTIGGPLLDVPLSVLKKVVKTINKAVPNSSSSKVIFKIVREIVGKWDQGWDGIKQVYQKWEVFFSSIIKNKNFVNLIGTFGDDLMNATQRVLFRFGESYAGYAVKVASGSTIAAAKFALRQIDKVDDVTAALIKGLPASKQDELFENIAKMRGYKLICPASGECDPTKWHGRIPDHELARIFKGENFKALDDAAKKGGWSGFESVLDDLAELCSSTKLAGGDQGKQKVAGPLAKKVSVYAKWLATGTEEQVIGSLGNLTGYINNIHQAAKLSRSSQVQFLEIAQNTRVGDLDIWATLQSGEQVIYELKFVNPGSTFGEFKKLKAQIATNAEYTVQVPELSNTHTLAVHVTSGLTPGQMQELILIGQKHGLSVQILNNIDDVIN